MCPSDELTDETLDELEKLCEEFDEPTFNVSVTWCHNCKTQNITRWPPREMSCAACGADLSIANGFEAPMSELIAAYRARGKRIAELEECYDEWQKDWTEERVRRCESAVGHKALEAERDELRGALLRIRDSQETDLGEYAKFCRQEADAALGKESTDGR